MSYCFSCRQEIKNGISLDDSETEHVCDSCWERIPVVWRLIVSKWFKDRPELNPVDLEIMYKPGEN